jgi:hypothetical protein
LEFVIFLLSTPLCPFWSKFTISISKMIESSAETDTQLRNYLDMGLICSTRIPNNGDYLMSVCKFLFFAELFGEKNMKETVPRHQRFHLLTKSGN